MSKEREQSAIDVIYQLLEEVKELRKEVKIIDGNIKLLNNKFSKLGSQNQIQQPSVTVPSVPKSPTSPISVPKQEVIQTIKLFGRIKNQARKPIKGVYIKVFDPSGNTIKSRETDSEGYWEARVAPGQYVIELNATHINKNFLPKNINISVDETMNEFEVK